MRRQSIVLIAAFGLSALLSLRGGDMPDPLGLDAPADVFSAQRARDALVRILGDGVPHTTGSAANAAVRDRVVAEFARLELPAQVQRRFICGTNTCATIENILVRLPGASRERAVLLSSHYDSVAAGPGAGDDGAGVASLVEVARALKAGPTLPRDVWFLVNDGEEIDLLGAEAFVREPEFADIASVVNLEARGTTGASLLIETQPGNAAMVPAVRKALARPAGTSLDYEIYKTLPNDTDFTVYKREGRTGASFALGHGAARYHTPLDNIAQLDSGSLQHHGDNLLSMARELAASEGELKAGHDAVFFSVFGSTLASWPVTWNLPLLALGLVAWTWLAVRLVRSRQARPLPLIGASLVMVLLPPLAGFLGWALHALLSYLGAMPAAWTAQESSLVASFALLGAAVAAFMAQPMARRFGLPVVAIASLFPYLLMAVAAVLAMPGASHVGLLPLLAGALVAHTCLQRPALWAGVAAVVTAALWFPYVVDAYVVVGHMALPMSSWLMTLVMLPLLPALAGLEQRARWVGGLALVGVAIFAALAIVRPAFDANTPRPVNLVYIGSAGEGRVYVNPFADLPENFLKDAGFGADGEAVLPWSQREFQGGRKGPALAAPVVEVLRDTVEAGRRKLQLRLRSVRGSTEGGLRLPGSVDLATVRIAGQPLVAPRHGPLPPSPYRGISVVGLPAEGVLIDFEAAAGEALVIYAVDSTPGIPAALGDVTRARDAIGMPIHNGDTSLAWAKLEL